MTLTLMTDRINKWDELYGRDGKRYGEKASIFCRLMIPYVNLKKPVKTLELGCGYGRDLSYLSRKFPDNTFVGFDAAQNALSIFHNDIHKHGISNIQGIQNNCLKLDSDLEKDYDLIFSHFFIHLFLRKEIKVLLSSAYKYLKNDGLFINSFISKGDKKFLIGGVRVEDDTYVCYPDKDWHFLHFWDEAEIKKVFSAYHFEVEFLFEYIEKESILGSQEESRLWFVVSRKKEKKSK